MESSNENEVAQGSVGINLNIDTNIDPDAGNGKGALNTPATTTSTSTNFSFGSPAEAGDSTDYIGGDDFVNSILRGAKEPLQIPYSTSSSFIDEQESNNSNITMARRSTVTSTSATIERNVHKRKESLIDKTVQLSILNKLGDEDYKYTHDSKYNSGSGEE